MPGTPIRFNDLFESGLVEKMKEIEASLDSMSAAIKEISSGKKIELTTATTSTEVAELVKQIQILNDALKKTREAKKVSEDKRAEIAAARHELSLLVDGYKRVREAEREQEKAHKARQKELEKVFADEAKREKAEAAAIEKAYQKRVAAFKRETDAYEKEQARKLNAASKLEQAEKKYEAEFQIRADEHMAKMREQRQMQELLDGSINATSLSYNELSAIYRRMSASLKNLSAEQINSNDANQRFAVVTRQVRDAMNEAQKAMGNYSLNVGRYHTAFDGLGYSIQQVLREVPSAINISQFFLAISNNIPMVIDQMKAFRDEQKGISEQLKSLQEGTKEYMELQSKQMSIGKKFLTSIFSWQTAILGVLLILRKYGADILKWFTNLFRKVEFEIHLMRWNSLINSIFNDANEGFASMTTKLTAIADRLKYVEKGTDEWREGIAQINKLTGANLDKLRATPEEIKKVTDKYIEQAKQIAMNEAIIDKLKESNVNFLNRRLADSAIADGSLESFASALGIKEDTEQYKEAEKLFKNLEKARSSLRKAIKVANVTYNEVASGNPNFKPDTYDAAKAVVHDKSRGVDEAAAALRSMASRIAPEMGGDEMQSLLSEYYKIVPGLDADKGKALKEKLAKYEDMWKEYMQNRYKILAEGEERERQQENDSFIVEMKDLEAQYNQKQKDLEEYAKQNSWANDKIERERGELKFQYDKIVEAKEKEHYDKLLEITESYLAKQREVRQNEEKAEDEATLGRIQVLEKALKRRVKSVGDETIRNNRIIANINSYQDAIEQLKNAIEELHTEEAKDKAYEQIDKYTEKIKKLREQIDHTRKLTGYSSFGDLLRRNAPELGSGNKQSLMEAVLGISYSAIWGDDTEGMMDAINSDFDKWSDAADKALQGWYENTKGYIEGIIDSYIDLANAKADAAKEETETAKSEYETQKALLEAGYANAVDTAYREYQEKKKLQEQAEKDAREAQKLQADLDSVTAASSLIVAVANLYKSLSSINIPFPGAGIALASTLSAAMLTAFGISKGMAAKAAKYGEGGYEELVGGSHASGHDIDLGVNNSQGRRMRAEGGESLAIFSRKAVGRYGNKGIKDIVDSINAGTYERESVALMNRNRELGATIALASRDVDLSRIENVLERMDRRADVSTYVDAQGNLVQQRANGRTTIVKK